LRISHAKISSAVLLLDALTVSPSGLQNMASPTVGVEELY
jgi:hypothetical protein